MIDAPPGYHNSVHPVTAIDGDAVSVTLSGPVRGRTVVMFEELDRGSDSYDSVRERLHLAMFRTVGIPTEAA